MLIQSIFKSEKDNNILENFHISSSGEYIEYLRNNNFLFLFDPKTDLTTLTNYQIEILDKRRKIK